MLISNFLDLFHNFVLQNYILYFLLLVLSNVFVDVVGYIRLFLIVEFKTFQKKMQIK